MIINFGDKQADVQNIPCFIRFGEHYTKIEDDRRQLIVNNYWFNMGIEKTIHEHSFPFANEGWVFITEEEFTEVLNKVSEYLSQFIPQQQTA